MKLPPFLAHRLAIIAPLAEQFIRAQRDRYKPRALPLSNEQLRAMQPFFSQELLADTRVLVLHDETVPNPALYKVATRLRIRDLPNFDTVAAVTFQDVIVSHVPFDPGLLFHELVHAEQYRQLGIKTFARLYVSGFLRSGGYDGIPIELHACALGARFQRDPLSPFSVEQDVAARIAAHAF